MCGVIHIRNCWYRIPCIVVPVGREWPPPPPIDFTQLELGDEASGPGFPDPWKVELTTIGGMLAAAGRFRDTDQAARLGTVIAEIGNGIAEQAQVDVRFEWTEQTS